jgi:hypothetical protein
MVADLRERLTDYGLDLQDLTATSHPDGRPRDPRRVILHELYMGASPEWMEAADEPTREAWRAASLAWLRERFEGDGVRRLISVEWHEDEPDAAPHLHVEFVPLVVRSGVMGRPSKDPKKRAEQERRAASSRRYELSDEEALTGVRTATRKGMSREDSTRIREEERAACGLAVEAMQSEYAARMAPFGLVRGEVGAKRRHRNAKAQRAALVADRRAASDARFAATNDRTEAQIDAATAAADRAEAAKLRAAAEEDRARLASVLGEADRILGGLRAMFERLKRMGERLTGRDRGILEAEENEAKAAASARADLERQARRGRERGDE